MPMELHPGVCMRCAADLRPPVTLACGHTYCGACLEGAQKCFVCHRPVRRLPPLDFITFRCGGCGRHYADHVGTRINQIHILPCGCRRMCKHTTRTCQLCHTTHDGATAIDFSATAIHCGVGLRKPDVPAFRCNPRQSAARRLCRWLRRHTRRTPAPGGLY